MRKIALVLLAAVTAGSLASCFVRSHRACPVECWWEHGRRVCEKRCH